MNEKNELILVDKYLLVVRRNLLLKDKDEIINNLHDEILFSLDGNYSEENVKIVLESFGNPALLAMKYQSSDKYLIGPQIYDLYLYAIKISMQISSIVYGIVMLVTMVIDISKSTFVLTAFISSTVGGYVWLIGQVFFWVTIVFAICQKTLSADQSQEYLQQISKWDVTKLKTVAPENQIKKADAIAAIIMNPIMYLLLFYFRHYTFMINSETLYLFDQSILPQIFVLFGVSSLISISVQILLLIKGRWTTGLVIYDLFAQICAIAVSYYSIVFLEMFAPLQASFLSQYYETIYFWITIGTIIITIITIVSSMYKLYCVVNEKRKINLN